MTALQRIIITGGPGFGKTSVLNGLEALGYPVFQEVSREIIDEEKKNGGENLPWLNHDGFHKKVFSGRLQQWKDATSLGGYVFFDRGIPDSLAYLVSDGYIPNPEEVEIMQQHPYSQPVFMVPPWEQIFGKDQQRWEEYEHAVHIHENLEAYYSAQGYEVIRLPFVSIEERVQFICAHLGIVR